MKTKVLLFIAVLLVLPNLGQTQSLQKHQESLKKIADGVIRSNVRGFVDYSTGKVYNDATALDPTADIALLSFLSEMEYPNGIINIAMLEIGDFWNDQKYIDYTMKNYNFIFDNVEYFRGKDNGRSKWDYPFGQFLVFEQLDDCGSMAAGFIDAYTRSERKDARKYIDAAADFVHKDYYRLEDGTFCRTEPVEMTIWADDLYMSVPFLARMGKLTGDNKYFDDAINQVLKYSKYLWDEKTQLYFHSWYGDNKENSIAHWNRANGWVAMAQVELLKYLPEDHPGRQGIIENLQRQLINVSKYQDASGLWHQLLDKENSYLETSGSAMFAYAIAYAVNQEILPERYMTVAVLAWEGIINQTDNFRVNGISMGTGIGNDLNYYYTRPQRANDVGFGTVLLAGLEVLKFETKNGGLKVNDRDRW